MRFVWTALLAFGMLAVQAGADAAETTKPADKPSAQKTLKLVTLMDKVSYAIGVQIAKNMNQQGLEINIDILAQAMKDTLAKAKPLMTDEEMQAALTQLTAELRQKQMQERAAAAEKNKKEGETFLAENKKKPGVITLPSGLQYKIIKDGTGKKPTATDKVQCHYRGTLIGGKEFDSSYGHSTPAEFAVNGVIPGWTEALKLMPVGSKWQLFVPSALGYGEMGNGPDIGPNATLIFDIELVAIK